MRVRLKEPTARKRPKRIVLKLWQELLHANNIALFQEHYSNTQVSLVLTVLPVEKDSPGWTSINPSVVGNFLVVQLLYSSWGLCENLQGLTTRNWIVMKKGGSAFNNQYLDLERLRSYLQHPSCSLNQWLFYLESQD